MLKNENLYNSKYLIIIFYPERNIGRPLSLRQQFLHKLLEQHTIYVKDRFCF